jgi:hypothetical protein
MTLRRRRRIELDGSEIVKIGAARALLLEPDLNEIEITLQLRGKINLRLRLRPRLARKLIQELTIAYEAINPPLHKSYNPADTLGMYD